MRVLIIDDMPAMRGILMSMLEEIGLSDVTEVDDAELAKQLIEHASTTPDEERFGLVISDWSMPGMSGIDLLRWVRSFDRSESTPFFMVTAKGNDVAIHEAMRAGATDYVVKPFTAEELAEKIRKLFPVGVIRENPRAD